MNPTFDQQIFRQTLGQFATGVTVVSFLKQGRVQAMTVNSFTSVSLDPPLILFCPSLTTRFALEAELGQDFAISILSQEQKDVCLHFAGVPNLDSEPWESMDHLPPVVAGCLGWMRCQITAIHEHGDHLVVLGEVQEFSSHSQAPPLLFFRRTYPSLADGGDEQSPG